MLFLLTLRMQSLICNLFTKFIHKNEKNLVYLYIDIFKESDWNFKFITTLSLTLCIKIYKYKIQDNF